MGHLYVLRFKLAAAAWKQSLEVCTLSWNQRSAPSCHRFWLSWSFSASLKTQLSWISGCGLSGKHLDSFTSQTNVLRPVRRWLSREAEAKSRGCSNTKRARVWTSGCEWNCSRCLCCVGMRRIYLKRQLKTDTRTLHWYVCSRDNWKYPFAAQKHGATQINNHRLHLPHHALHVFCTKKSI